MCYHWFGIKLCRQHKSDHIQSLTNTFSTVLEIEMHIFMPRPAIVKATSSEDACAVTHRQQKQQMS